MTPVFFFGTLCHLPLLEVVLGRAPVARPARLEDHAVYWAEGDTFPVIRVEPGAVAHGIVVEVDTAEIARLDFYEGPYDFLLRPITVEGPDGPVRAQFYWPEPGSWQPGAPWTLADWTEAWGAIMTRAAVEIMAAYPEQTATDVAKRGGIITARAQAYINGESWARPRSLGNAPKADAVEVVDHHYDHLGFFTLESFLLRYPRINGGAPITARRAVFRAGEAATVLPYDPVRDRVLLIEQFRAAPFAQGDPDPWILEPVAGIVDAGETAEEAARREAQEEAGIELSTLHFNGRYYPTPGATAQVLHSYVGIADLPDDMARVGGLQEEGEDIAIHLVSFDVLMEMAEVGALVVAPLLISAQWLAANRDRLRGGA
ncbi:MAG: NUDIX domain-containing protein [Pseudomonadota bacterium]